jgi:hypothetical protein
MIHAREPARMAGLATGNLTQRCDKAAQNDKIRSLIADPRQRGLLEIFEPLAEIPPTRLWPTDQS